ncbi:MAG: 23S rRNA (adenine(2503)-C(2))-methyltransferase [Candidatus Lambdaproteobacteria bacterium RIFOXYD12_FULL_49_8]|uniref:Dual-specificity RNA methyltransferase RlmN n=1 Tax=Candidatus Lambdaproteobacteria bacterium RIFOXYD2_FULL_50_16 TaxID=1817772 RepID=A0A1F6GFS5_9PROT|nr:MAG: 23S rRNA (adenine(2503)-C(2))-methyltransferase [Candidatus Lambdaproteobacteria bacterium RIFOXYD12_FULL_49_8]OGG96960.1 MAG: 23S rRNA (adenine(2503)-C(2))-methyltransferase [Candidatus Lambdaproteobacteria bacterium RIFOXYD2_FULL_50_16]
MINLYEFTRADLKAWLVKEGQKPFNAEQIYHWLYAKGARDFWEMSNLSKSLRSLLSERFCLTPLLEVGHKTAQDGTIKLLLSLADQEQIETVLLRHSDHNTLCLSTQVGCAMACKFCLTAKMGLKRNLTPAEIVGQILAAKAHLPEGQGIRNLVFMGMGEPLHNYDNLILALKILLDPRGLDYSWRRVTISTSGLVEGIRRFWAEPEVRAMLAISLNGVTQEERQLLMPVSKRHDLESLIQALKEMPPEKKDRITFEYVLLRDHTDGMDQAKRLVALLNGIKAKVNLIEFNEHPDLPFRAPDPARTKAFQRYLLDKGLLATLRAARGQDVAAACGQLATDYAKQLKELK